MYVLCRKKSTARCHSADSPIGLVVLPTVFFVEVLLVGAARTGGQQPALLLEVVAMAVVFYHLATFDHRADLLANAQLKANSVDKTPPRVSIPSPIAFPGPLHTHFIYSTLPHFLGLTGAW